MIKIIKTKGVGYSIVSYYIEKDNCFAIYLEKDNEKVELERINSIMFLVEIHDYWVKFTDILSTSFSDSQVENHLTIAS